ncbi:(E,E)-alpha-farnesene synthase isoform X2 [Capsicum galapagoense]
MTLSQLFEKEVKRLYKTWNMQRIKKYYSQMDLYSTTLLHFRIFRQHGYNVPQDVFLSYIVEMGEQFLVGANMDPKTLVQLFEASHLALEDENMLDGARIFCTNNLKSSTNVIPLHWKVEWYNARRQLSIQENDESGSKFESSLRLAKLNFNMIQAEHQKDLVDILS